MTVAVVILNYNGEKLLKQFLPSVVEHSPEARVYVADNGSTDDSLALIRREFPSVTIIPFDQNYGFCKGYNEALKRVPADIHIMLNSDVEVTPGWIPPMVDIFRRDDSVAAVQPKVLSYADKHVFEHSGAAGGLMDVMGYPFCRGRLFDETETDAGQYDDERPVFWTSGACMAVRAACYRLAGGLDEDFFAHMEEIDLCWTFHRMNKTVWYTGKSTIYHVGAGTLAYTHPRKTYFNFRNNLFMLAKHWSPGEVWLKFPIRMLLDWVAAVTFVIKGKGGHGKAVMRAHLDFLKSWRITRRKRKALRRTYPGYPDDIIYPRPVLLSYLTGTKPTLH